MSGVVNSLVEMGFPKERVELAASKTGSQDVQTVMDYLLSHEEELDAALENGGNTEPNPLAIDTSSSSAVEGSDDTGASSESTPQAKSIKCDDCEKLFKSNEEVEFHAAKTGHEHFWESTEEKKALSEEEKKEQLAKIEAKLKQRRLEREAKEKEEALLREKNRIKSGKELLEVKRRHEETEMKKIMEQRKREKEEERLAREKVKKQIEADKLARKAKFSGDPQENAAPTPQPVPEPVEKKSPQNYTEARLLIRLLNGQTLVQNFGVKEPLSAVRFYVEMNRTGEDQTPFKLMTSYPRRIFGPEDYDKPLDSLGLVPTATLVISRS